MQSTTVVDALYRAHRSALVQYLKRAGATEEEASDAVQIAFTQLLRASATIRDPHAWLHRTALNAFRGSTSRIPSLRRKVIETPMPPREMPESTTRVPSAADVAVLNEEHQMVLAQLALLPDKQRQVMVGRYDQLTHEEIADLLGMSTDAVRQNLSRARKTLRKRRATTQRDLS